MKRAHSVLGVAEADARPRGVSALHRLFPAAPRFFDAHAGLNIVLLLARDRIDALEVRDPVLAALDERVLRPVLAHFSEDLALTPVSALRDEQRLVNNWGIANGNAIHNLRIVAQHR